MIRLIQDRRQGLEEICARFSVSRLEAFGSAIRDDFSTDESDLDLLVEFKAMEPYARVDAYFGMREQLEALFERKIDLVMVDAVKNPYIAGEIERTKQLLYAA